MKKEANYKKDQVLEKDRGMPDDTELEKEIAKARKNLMKKIAEAEKKAKKK